MSIVHVKLFATLLHYRPDLRHGQTFDLPLLEGQDVNNLIAGLRLPEEAVKHIFVNGKRVTPGYLPRDGDEVALFPPIAGG